MYNYSNSMPVDQNKEITKPNLYLVGFMGVGKSAVGARLARELEYSFIDSDKAIEESVEKSIPEIFAEDGEAVFRQYEREFIESGHPVEGCIVSCGGGLFVQKGMPELLQSKGLVVCLSASIESILKRTQKSQNRPLLEVDDREARIRELFAKREPIYRRAGISLSTEGRSISEVAKHVLRVYKKAVS